MWVDLQSLEPNPTRDFSVDPLDQEAVERLRQSIEEDGFWGGIVCRQVKDGTIQTGAGHHRVAAAIAAGIMRADVFVSKDMDDHAMSRVYARENATQRGNSGAARAGSVASALRIIAKETYGVANATQSSINQGIGWKTILDYLRNIPGINARTVQDDLASLKASGHYARILAEIEAEIAKEAAEAKARAEQDKANERAKAEAEAKAEASQRATKASKAATENNPRKFDFEGVAKHLKNSNQIDAFRETVTGNGIASYLPVNKQAELAAHLAQEVAEKNKTETKKKTELSAEYIRNGIQRLVIDAKRFKAETDKETAAAAIARDLDKKAKSLQHDFAGYFRSMARVGTQITELMARWPKGQAFPITGEFRDVLATAKKVIDSLSERI